MNEVLSAGLRVAFSNKPASAEMLELISLSSSLSGIILLMGKYSGMEALTDPIRSLQALESGDFAVSDLDVILPLGPLGGPEPAKYALHNIVGADIIANIPTGVAVPVKVLSFLSKRRDIIFRDEDIWSMLADNSKITPSMLRTAFDQVAAISSKMISRLFSSEGLSEGSKKFFWENLPIRDIDPDYLAKRKFLHSKIAIVRKAVSMDVPPGYANVAADLVFSGQPFAVALESLGFNFSEEGNV